ncbi:MAG: hypothetical protein MUF00_07990 [Gemmatimonadaceae bacterium]|nr:hypothetical protein [Gemmatimonadaceae bacterium]
MSDSDVLYDTGSLPGAANRLLLVSAAFPPHAVVGATRWEQFATRLVADGLAVDVICERPGPGDLVDYSRVEGLPPGIRVIAIAPGEPLLQRAYVRAKRLLHGDTGSTLQSTEIQSSPAATGAQSVQQPDLRERYHYWLSGARAHRWIRAAANAARAHVTAAPDAIVSSGPPHLGHIAGREIAAAFQRPHIIDLRDPWESDLAKWGSPARAVPSAADELSLMKTAAHTIANTPAAEELLLARAPWAADKVSTILNGSDLAIRAPASDRTPFLAVHTGTLHLSRDPRPFLRAARAFVQQAAVAPADWRVVFMGHPAVIAGVPMPRLVEEHGLGTYFDFRPPAPRAEAQALMQRAHMLLAFPGLPTQVPYKIYEYTSFSAWLLAMVGLGSAPATLLAGTSAIVTDGDDEPAILRALHDTWARHGRGEVPTAAGQDGRFLRERQYERLRALLHHAVQGTVR